jgi:hypothetical protein
MFSDLTAIVLKCGHFAVTLKKRELSRVARCLRPRLI